MESDDEGYVEDEDQMTPMALPAMSAAEREEAERLHKRAVRAEAMAAAQDAAASRGIALKKENQELLKAEQQAKPKFLTKAERQQEALERLEVKRAETQKAAENERYAAKSRGSRGGRFSAPPVVPDTAGKTDAARLPRMSREDESDPRGPLFNAKRGREESGMLLGSGPTLNNAEKELKVIREAYLGKGPKKKRIVKPSEKFSRIFQFDWNAEDDTSVDLNPLYARRHQVQPLLGRGYVAGLDMREQRRQHTFAQTLADKRDDEARLDDLAEGSKRAEREQREAARKEEREKLTAESAKVEEAVLDKAMGKKLLHWSEKKLEDMVERDWRIFKEDFDIRVRGGKAPLPLRRWDECADLNPSILRAIASLKYKEPTPIQRQAITVGLELRDIIGVAETGSGKTASFAIPMLNYISHLPAGRIAALADDGPLAVVLVPTRELATQINAEIKKLAANLSIKTCVIVGGASIEDQAFILREGVEIIVGTPGRINDCLETQHLVLNQANYVVLDEADRMIDMGFEPQVNTILDAMGGLLKSEDELEMAQQEAAVKRGEACYRITAMFSATMPPAVERLARKFMRMPAIVSIGDEDSGKNKRIAQHVLYMGDTHKKSHLVDMLRRKKKDEKYLVFCNEKKGCDAVYKHVQAAGLRAAVIHGGKTQDHRDNSLDSFKKGTVSILIATDVAGRGLDIPDVAHVINFDMPLKIENYCHRIGRTGRAGKDGLASTFLTDADEGTMYELREYLEQTDAEIPEQLERNPAAHVKPGERNDRGQLLTDRLNRGGTEYLKEDMFHPSTGEPKEKSNGRD